jgi:hypothetical protein
LKRFVGEAKLPMASIHRTGDKSLGAGLRPFLPEVATLRAALNLPMADEIADPRKNRPVFDLSKLPADLPRQMAKRGDWADNADAVIDALCEYLDTLAPRNVRQPTQGDYRKEQQKGRSGDWPSPSTLGRIRPKSFTAWIEQAQVEWQKRRKQSGSKVA